MSCIYCGKVILNKGSLRSHELRCKLNPERKVYPQPWNKGLTKDSSPIVAEITKKSLETRKLKGTHKGHPHSEHTKEKLRRVAKERGLGGYQERSGRGKKGRYKGIWCDSSWELAFVIKSMDEGKKVSRSTEKRSYLYEGEERVYYPDFLVDETLVEIKGWASPQWEAKRKCNPDIVVLGKEEMKPILDYVIGKHGRNFVDLYEEKGFVEKRRKRKVKTAEEKEKEKIDKLKARLESISLVDFSSPNWPQICSEILNISVKSSKDFVRKHLGIRTTKTETNRSLPQEVIDQRLLLLSQIDMTKFGWVSKAEKALGLSHASVKGFVDKYYQGKVFETFKKIQHQQGERNSQYGTMWVTNGSDNLKIKKDSPIPEGYRRGRTQVSKT